MAKDDESNLMRYYFEWDTNKAKDNSKKHKVSFERAATIFRDPRAISIFDKGHSEDEERWITMGIDASGILLVVVHTYRQIGMNSCAVRLISARKSTKNEASQYRRENI